MKIASIIHNFIWPKPAPFKPRGQNTIQTRSIEELLAELSFYGRPKLLQTETGWWCFIDATDDSAGAKLTIGSELFHSHPVEAISVCLQRVEASGLPKHALLNATTPKF